MGFFDWLFGISGSVKDTRNRVFISFAIEDETYRDYLVRQARTERSPFDFIDMSVKVPWEEHEWKRMCRTKMKRCHRVIVLLSSNTAGSRGVQWEVKCAKDVGVKMVAIYVRKTDRCPKPAMLKGVRVMDWTWDNLERFLK